MRFALGRFAQVIRTVHVRIEDVDRPQGGMDKRCVVEVSGDPAAHSVVEAQDESAWTAVDRAAEIAGRAVSRALERARLSGGLPSRTQREEETP